MTTPNVADWSLLGYLGGASNVADWLTLRFIFSRLTLLIG